jgi:2'-5' RNA ligase
MKRLFIAINLPEQLKNSIAQIITEINKAQTNADDTQTNAEINKTQTNVDDTQTNADTTQTNADYTQTNADSPRESAFSQRGSVFRWIPKEQWHLTITFLGYQPDEAIEPILRSIKQTVQDYSNILKNNRIVFEKIILAPPRKTPRMIWLDATKETSKILGMIKNKLEDELVKNGVRFRRENREYHAHLTLARFQQTRTYADLTLTNADNISVNQRSNQHESLLLAFYAESLDLMESHLKPTGAEYEILAKVDFMK